MGLDPLQDGDEEERWQDMIVLGLTFFAVVLTLLLVGFAGVLLILRLFGLV